MMITNLGFLARIFMVFHIKSTNQRLCNGLRRYEMSFFLLGANERIGKTDKLMKLFKLVNWDRVDKCLSSLRKNALYSLGGPKGYNKLSMFVRVHGGSGKIDTPLFTFSKPRSSKKF